MGTATDQANQAEIYPLSVRLFGKVTSSVRLATVFLLVVVCLARPREAIAELDRSVALMVEGKVTEEMFRLNGSIITNLSTCFSLRIHETSWLLTMGDCTSLQGGKVVARRQVGFDGRDVFELISTTREEALEASTLSSNRFFGFVNEGFFPRTRWPLDRILWLAFCSTERFNTTTNLPSFRSPNDLLAQVVSCRLERITADGLPSVYEQLVPGSLRVREAGSLKVIPYPPPLDSGYVEFAYRVLDVTNVYNLSVPLRFEAEFFAIESDFRSFANRRLTNRRVGVLSGVQRLVEVVGLPMTAESANVYDYRFTNKSGQPVMYQSAGGEEPWINRNDPQITETIAHKQKLAVSKRSRSAPQATTIRRVILSAILCVTAAAVLLIIRFRVMHSKPNETIKPKNPT